MLVDSKHQKPTLSLQHKASLVDQFPMQVLDLLQSCGVAKQDHQLAEVFQITSVADELFPCMQNFSPQDSHQSWP